MRPSPAPTAAPPRSLRICRVATIPFVVALHMRPQLEAAVRAGHRVDVVCSDGPEAVRIRQMRGVRLFVMPIYRRISPLRDLVSLARLITHFRRERYDIVHSMTPKAGLLAALAALLAGVPCRLHHFTGQPWVGMRGLAGFLARASDWLIVRLNTACYADSASQAAFLESRKIAPRGSIRVLGDGSFSGVDLTRFDPERLRSERDSVRAELGIPSNALLIGYVGRLTPEKGLSELLQAQATLRSDFDPWILMAGPYHPDIEPLPAQVLSALERGEKLRWIGYTEVPERYMAACDIICLPSYREGFPLVMIEAAALGLPAVATRIVGCVDAVEHGVTGLLVEPKDAHDLARGLGQLCADAKLRADLGRAGRERAIAHFSAQRVNGLLLEEYERHCSDRRTAAQSGRSETG